MWWILRYAGPEVCVCVSVGSTWFFLSDMPANWAEERFWCSNIHKINFSCGCEVNFLTEHLEWISTNLRDRLSSPVQPGWSRKKSCLIPTCTLAHFGYGTCSYAYLFFPQKKTSGHSYVRFWVTHILQWTKHFKVHETISVYTSSPFLVKLWKFDARFQILPLNTIISFQKELEFVFGHGTPMIMNFAYKLQQFSMHKRLFDKISIYSALG